MRARTASILALGLFALALGLSACGSSAKSAVDPVAVAAEKTAAAKTARFSMTMTEQASALPGPLTMTAEGAENFADRQISMSMDMSQMASMAGGNLGSPSDWKIDTVMSGLVMYMRAPFLRTLLKSDKPWFKVDMESIGKKQGLDLSSLMSYDPSQTMRFVDYLRGSKDMQVVGHESIRGVTTRHYRGSVDFANYLNALPAGQRAAAKAALDRVGKLGKPVYSAFDVWIDTQNRVRREAFSYSISAATAGQLELKFSMDFYDFDAPVTITIPPVDQTVDLMQLAGSLGSS